MNLYARHGVVGPRRQAAFKPAEEHALALGREPPVRIVNRGGLERSEVGQPRVRRGEPDRPRQALSTVFHRSTWPLRPPDNAIRADPIARIANSALKYPVHLPDQILDVAGLPAPIHVKTPACVETTVSEPNSKPASVATKACSSPRPIRFPSSLVM